MAGKVRKSDSVIKPIYVISGKDKFLVSKSCNLLLDTLLDAEDWGLEDPYGQSTEKYREIRDLIEELVKELIRKI